MTFRRPPSYHYFDGLRPPPANKQVNWRGLFLTVEFAMSRTSKILYVPQYKVFISYHHENDEEYKRRLVQALTSKAVDKSVSPGDIHPEQIMTDEIRRRIRDDHIAGAEVTIVLMGECTWQRKHVDWEISASLIDRRNNHRNGLVGILLPTHPDYRKPPKERNPRLMPPRLADNNEGENPFAVVYDWPKIRVARRILPKVHQAFQRKNGHHPDDSYPHFANNRSGDCLKGWQS